MPSNPQRLIATVMAALVVGLAAVITYNLFLSYALWSARDVTLERAMRVITSEYVEPVDKAKLVNGAVNGMVGSLGDPYSEYLTGLQYTQLRDATQGEYYGIGIALRLMEGKHVVAEVFEGTPAAEAGLKRGDDITEVDGKEAGPLSAEDIVRVIKGRAGTKVSLRVRREGVAEPLAFEMMRRKIEIATVRSSVLPGNIGYVRIIEFASNTLSQFKDAVAKLDAEKVSGLVLDLRGSPGGLLEQAVAVADVFLAKGVIVTVKGRQDAEEVWNANDDGSEPSYPVAVLIDKATASAAEILAAALRDNGRAEIVGMKSFGKGSVQRVIDLAKDSALKITVARYYTPAGKYIGDNGGITPDVKVEPGKKEEEMLPGDTPDPASDPVLKKALEVLKPAGQEGTTAEGGAAVGERPA